MEKFTAAFDSKIGNYRQGTIFEGSKPDSIHYYAFDDLPKGDEPPLSVEEELIDASLHGQDKPYFKELDAYIGCHMVVPGSDGMSMVSSHK